MAEANDTGLPERLSADARQRLLESDAKFVGKPFDMGANPRAIQANTRHLALILRDTQQSERASRAAAFAEALTDSVLAHQVTEPVACGKGCSWCCTTYVTATVPEIFNLARAVRASPSGQRRVADAANRAKTIPQHKREASRIVCPILESNACGQYAHRPLICRSLLSTSLEACLRILVENRPTEMTHADNTVLIRTATTIMMKAALILSGLPAQHYELIQGVEAALAYEDAEGRWLRGEPIFAAVPVDSGDTAAASPLKDLITVLVNAVRPTI